MDRRNSQRATLSGRFTQIMVLETRFRPFSYFAGQFGILSFEHDPDCHNFAGLLTDMQRAYGKGFTKKDEVTLVFFRVVTPLNIQLIDLVEDSYQCLKCSKRFRVRWTRKFGQVAK